MRRGYLRFRSRPDPNQKYQMAFYSFTEQDDDLQKAAVHYINLDVVKLLLSIGASVNQIIKQDDSKNTLLHCINNVEINKEFLLRGAIVNARNKFAETPLHYAIISGKKLQIVRDLLYHGAKVNAKTRKGNTALNLAVKKKETNLKIIKELLKYGADINIQNREHRSYEYHRSPLDNAVGSLKCAKLLIKYALLNNFSEDYTQIVNLDRYEESHNYSKLLSCLNNSVEEIRRMKTDEIKDGLTLYNLVTNKTNSNTNNSLSVKLTNISYSKHYPLYNSIILEKLKPFTERGNLLYQLSNTKIYTKFQNDKETEICLDFDSALKITEYLLTSDLLNFVKAFNDSND